MVSVLFVLSYELSLVGTMRVSVSKSSAGVCWRTRIPERCAGLSWRPRWCCVCPLVNFCLDKALLNGAKNYRRRSLRCMYARSMYIRAACTLHTISRGGGRTVLPRILFLGSFTNLPASPHSGMTNLLFPPLFLAFLSPPGPEPPPPFLFHTHAVGRGTLCPFLQKRLIFVRRPFFVPRRSTSSFRTHSASTSRCTDTARTAASTRAPTTNTRTPTSSTRTQTINTQARAISILARIISTQARASSILARVISTQIWTISIRARTISIQTRTISTHARATNTRVPLPPAPGSAQPRLLA